MFNLSIACVVSAGANLVYSVQHTYDNIYDPSVVPTWFDNVYMNSLMANAQGNIDIPVQALRLNVTSYTGGNVTMTLVSQG